jgi:FtsX-like permease family
MDPAIRSSASPAIYAALSWMAATPDRFTCPCPQAAFRTTRSSFGLGQTRRGSWNAIGPVIASLDPNLVATTSTLDQMLHQTPPFLISGLAAVIASIIGMLGLLLALMGIFGTVSYIVVLRTREVGIRIALGAKKRDILGLMLRESTQPVFAGLLVGVILSVGASYLLRGILYGVNIVDSVSFVGVSFLFLAIALFATYLPSRRAMTVDPIVALRYE